MEDNTTKYLITFGAGALVILMLMGLILMTASTRPKTTQELKDSLQVELLKKQLNANIIHR